MVNAALRWLSQRHGQVQCPDRQIPLHAVTDRPADDTPRIQIAYDGQIQPTLTGPDIGYIARPFLVWGISREVLVQQIRRNVERVVTVRLSLVFLGRDDLDVVFTHQAANASVPDLQSQLL